VELLPGGRDGGVISVRDGGVISVRDEERKEHINWWAGWRFSACHSVLKYINLIDFIVSLISGRDGCAFCIINRTV
jgi:hypothetical protein